jgi:hypothetical protein
MARYLVDQAGIKRVLTLGGANAGFQPIDLAFD